MLTGDNATTARAVARRLGIQAVEAEVLPTDKAQAVERVAEVLIEPPTTAAESSSDVEVVARGLGASPGLVSGAVATTPDPPKVG